MAVNTLFCGLMRDGSEVDATERCCTRKRIDSGELAFEPNTSDGCCEDE